MSDDRDFIIFDDSAPEQSLPTGKNLDPIVESADNYHSQYLMLLTTSQFLTTIQNLALYTETLAEHDTSNIFDLIHQYQRNSNTFSPVQKQQLNAELSTFRAKIEETDARVQTSNIRRLFERLGTPDQISLARVISYYLTKTDKSFADRDKIDLLVTRWGAFSIPGTERMIVLRSEHNLIQKLEKLFNKLRLVMDEQHEESEVLSWLDRYRASLLRVDTMGKFVENNYQRRLREYKISLGNFFYRPKVLAAIVEVNVTLHNILQEFYLSERSRLELYVDHAKRKTESDEIGRQPDTLFSLMSRAEQMRHILTETQAAIASQQVLDQASKDNDELIVEGEKSNVDELVVLLEQTLKRTHELSQQIQQEIAKRYEKVEE